MVDCEAEKSINIAEKAMGDGDFDKAKRFLLKSLKIQQTEKARLLLERCSNREEAKAPPRKQSEEKGRRSQSQPHEEKEAKSAPSYSQADARLCDEILRKTNYYEILGVEKNAQTEQIKKSYRRLAIKLHPDKNHAPQATEAFKKVSQAFSCLNDENKRRIYDQHGTETNFRQQYHQYFDDEDEFDAEDIFEMFFSGMRNPNRRRNRQRRTFFYTNNFQGQNQDNQRGRFGVLFQFLPILLILVFALLFQMKGLTGGDNYSYSHYFSFSFSSEYSIKHFTQKGKVKYFVSREFHSEIENDSNLLATVEKEVLFKYIKTMRNKCNQAHSDNRNLRYNLNIAKRRGYNTADIERAINQLDFKPCNEYNRLEHYLL